MSEKQSTLPNLERQLVTAASAAGASRPWRWRWPVVASWCVAVVAVGAATAGVLTGTGTEIDRGQTPAGTYAVQIKRDSRSTPADEICLQMRVEKERPAYGCGVAPTSSTPFGVLVVDQTPITDGMPTQQVAYGLAAENIARVSVLGPGTDHYDAETVARADLPGRYFGVVSPAMQRIEIVGYDASGAEVARVGSRRPPDHQPISHDDAVALGDPAGFAPTAVPLRHFSYESHRISPQEASDLGLTCDDGSGVCSR
jgi:hypothetical protein